MENQSNISDDIEANNGGTATNTTDIESQTLPQLTEEPKSTGIMGKIKQIQDDIVVFEKDKEAYNKITYSSYEGIYKVVKPIFNKYNILMTHKNTKESVITHLIDLDRVGQPDDRLVSEYGVMNINEKDSNVEGAKDYFNTNGGITMGKRYNLISLLAIPCADVEEAEVLERRQKSQEIQARKEARARIMEMNQQVSDEVEKSMESEDPEKMLKMIQDIEKYEGFDKTEKQGQVLRISAKLYDLGYELTDDNKLQKIKKDEISGDHK